MQVLLVDTVSGRVVHSASHPGMRGPLTLLLGAATSDAYLLHGLVSSRPACLVSSRPGSQLLRVGSCEMNLGERFVRLVKSNVNQALNSMEDPEKVLTQAVDDMQKDLIKVRQAYAEVSASTKRMEEQCRRGGPRSPRPARPALHARVRLPAEWRRPSRRSGTRGRSWLWSVARTTWRARR